MRILIHSLAALEIGGSDRHLRGMLSVLGEYGPDVDFLLYINNLFSIVDKPKNVVIRSIPMRGPWQRLWWDQIMLPKIVKGEGIDIIWATLGFGPLKPPVPQIMFQRNPVYYNNACFQNPNLYNKTLIRLRRRLLLEIMQSSSFVITPTAAMRDMILAVHPDITTEKFKVIPHAVSPDGMNSKSPDNIISKISTCTPETIKILYVGNILPGKGLFNMLDAVPMTMGGVSVPIKFFLTISRDDWPEGYDLFIQKIADMGLTENVEIIGKLSGDCMGALYRTCDVLIYPSACESFGFPLYEALSQGLPIVAADTTVNREAAGECALYYQPSGPQSIAATLKKIVNETVVRDSLSKAGKIRFKKNQLLWSDYCGRCLELSSEAIANVKKKNNY